MSNEQLKDTRSNDSDELSNEGVQLLKDGLTGNRKHLISYDKDSLKQGHTTSLKDTSSVSLARKSKGNCTTGNDETNVKDYRELRRYGSDSSPAFSVKRSSRFEYMDPEEEEEPQEELTRMLSRRELEAIKEDAVNEVAMIIESINAELEENECKFVQYHSFNQVYKVAKQIRSGPNTVH